MKEIFLGKPTAKQLEWMKERMPWPADQTVVKFKDGKTWTGRAALSPDNQYFFGDRDLQNAGAFDARGREDVAEILVQDDALGLGAYSPAYTDGFDGRYSSLSSMVCQAGVWSIAANTFAGSSLKKIVFKEKTQAKAEEIADRARTGLPADCVVVGELG